MEEYRRWEDNIKMDLKEIGVNVRSWIDSNQDRDYWRALVIAVSYAMLLWRRYGRTQEMGGQY